MYSQNRLRRIVKIGDVEERLNPIKLNPPGWALTMADVTDADGDDPVRGSRDSGPNNKVFFSSGLFPWANWANWANAPPFGRVVAAIRSTVEVDNLNKLALVASALSHGPSLLAPQGFLIRERVTNLAVLCPGRPRIALRLHNPERLGDRL